MSVDYDAIAARRTSAAAPVLVTENIKAQVTASLASAFHQDPVMNWFVRQDGKHDEAMTGLIGYLVEAYMKAGWAIAAEDGSCATLWAKPGKTVAPIGFMQQIAWLPRIMRTCSLPRVPRGLNVMNALDANHPHEPDHYYLLMIGVHADHQGQGLGSTILAKALETVDAEGMPAYLENSNPKNTPLYERNGFKVMKEIKFGPDGPSLWPMWREARTLRVKRREART